MDQFSLFILEDTLQFATEVLPSELISEYVADIRDYVNVVVSDRADVAVTRRLHAALNALSAIARDNNKFVVHMRLQSIAREFKFADAA